MVAQDGDPADGPVAVEIVHREVLGGPVVPNADGALTPAVAAGEVGLAGVGSEQV